MNIAAPLLQSLEDSARIFHAKALSYPPELICRKPNAIAFSATEIVYHMLDVESLWQGRITRLVSGESNQFLMIDPDALARDANYNDKPFAEGLEAWAKAREATLKLVEGLSDDELRLEGIHSKYGPMTILEMLERMANHDLGHAAQLDRTLHQVTENAE